MDNEKDSVAVCMDFFQKGYPKSGPKNFRTQLGVHFEEIAEMMATLDPSSPEDGMLIHYVGEAIKAMATHLKTTDGVIGIKDRVEFLDGAAQLDQCAGDLRHVGQPAGLHLIERGIE